MTYKNINDIVVGNFSTCVISKKPELLKRGPISQIITPLIFQLINQIDHLFHLIMHGFSYF